MNNTGPGVTIAGALSGCLSDPADSTELRVDQLETTATRQTYFVRGDLGRAAGDPLAPALPSITSTLGVAATDLRVKRVEHDALGMTHVRLGQHKNGLRVVS